MIAILYWVVLIVAIVFGLWAPSQPQFARWSWAPWVFLFILIGLRIFGNPLHS